MCLDNLKTKDEKNFEKNIVDNIDLTKFQIKCDTTHMPKE